MTVAEGEHSSDSAGSAGSADSADSPRVIAFYLPQFHAVPENDAWHGTGFTEWNVVARSRPLFPGHDQPHLPAELGFYDLRVPEVREAQARLARRAGISGFLYYHYWFRGRRMLERTFGEVLRSGRPDFPFALCWANESWFRRWQHESDELLLEQTYDEADDLEHIRWLIDAFRDPRYIRVHGRPLLAVYRPHLLADPKVTFDVWREECATAGVAEPWLVAFETEPEMGDPAELGFDASAEFVPHGLHLLVDPLERPAGMDVAGTLYDYTAAAAAYLGRPAADWTRYPCVATGWDNTPRRPDGEAIMLHGSTPEGYRAWLAEAIAGQARSEGAHGIVFVNAWNEWGEGAHLEPDVTNGRAYLDATRSAVEAIATAEPPLPPSRRTTATTPVNGTGDHRGPLRRPPRAVRPAAVGLQRARSPRPPPADCPRPALRAGAGRRPRGEPTAGPRRPRSRGAPVDGRATHRAAHAPSRQCPRHGEPESG